jgi:alpha-L-fucosidase
LLNVGPTGEGLIPEPSVERLAAFGEWMKVNSVAIYETQASPFKKLDWGRCTSKASGKDTILYLHVFNWPHDGKLVVPGLNTLPNQVFLLNDKEHKPLVTSTNADGLVLLVPSIPPDAISSTVVLRFLGSHIEIAAD